MPSTPAPNKRVKGVQVFRPIGIFLPVTTTNTPLLKQRLPLLQCLHEKYRLITLRKFQVYGNIAVPIPKESRTSSIPADHTHQWTISVKGVQNEDITYFIKRVSFKLHETYTNSLRTIDTPPFEVTETGWGEFGIQVKIYFVSESNEKPLIFYHHLALHPYGPDKDVIKEQNRPVQSYQYEEIVFNEPTEAMYEVLTTKKAPELPAKRTGKIQYAMETEGEEEDRLVESMKQVQELKDQAKESLLSKEKALAAMKAVSTKIPKEK